MIANIDKDVEKWESSFFSDENVKCRNHVHMIHVHMNGKHILKMLNINLSYEAAITSRSIPRN